MLSGILLVDKPVAWSSFDVVHKVRRIIENSGLNDSGKKRFPVGHTGTLDPLAAGLLILLLGDYTKRASELVKLSKIYEVTMQLGQVSTTGDQEGRKSNFSTKQPSLQEVITALQHFIGDSEQVPPAYSAIKINGERAYKLARRGDVVTLKPRPIHVYSLDLTDYSYPYASFTVHVSSGTYIRSLVEDIGKLLATGAYMSNLRRTKVGEFSVDSAIPVAALSPQLIQERSYPLP